MVRSLWSMFVALLWVRSKTSARTARKLTAKWDGAAKKLGLKPPEKATFLQQYAYARRTEDVDAMGERAAKAGGLAARRFKSYTRAANFLPRWVWAYVPYAEISALGVAVGWLAHNRPEMLASGINQAVNIAGTAFHLLTTYPGEVEDFCIYNPGVTIVGGLMTVCASIVGGVTLWCNNHPIGSARAA